MLTNIQIDDIGVIQVEKSLRARRMTIKIKPFEGIKLTIPEKVSFAQAEKFVIAKKSWISKNLPKIKSFEDKHTIFDQKTHFKTRFHELDIQTDYVKDIQVFVIAGKIQVRYPFFKEVKDFQVQELIRKGIVEALRIEAKSYLPFRTKELAKKHNFKYNRVSVRNSKTRWGSCSSQDNINLNIHLMRLSDALIDYVILHELCHTKVKNHSQEFWDLMKTILPETLELDKELKNYSTTIY